jgi:hypothetical protein
MLSEFVKSIYILIRFIYNYTYLLHTLYPTNFTCFLFSSRSLVFLDHNVRFSIGQREQVPDSNSLGDSSTDSLRFINLIPFEG